MDHTWAANAVGAAPTKPTTLQLGYPTDTATPTIPGAYWFYQMTEEIRNVVVNVLGAGAPDAGNVSQLYSSIITLFNQATYTPTFINNSSGPAAVGIVATLQRTPFGGVAANGMAGELMFSMQDQGGSLINTNAIRSQWTDVTVGNRKSSLIFSSGSGGALTDSMILDSTGKLFVNNALVVAGALSTVGSNTMAYDAYSRISFAPVSGGSTSDAVISQSTTSPRDGANLRLNVSGAGGNSAPYVKLSVNDVTYATVSTTGLSVAGSVSVSTGLNVAGNGGFYNSANKFGLDNVAGLTRMYSSGANSSSRGSYDFRVTDSVGTLDMSAMTLSATGASVTGVFTAAGAKFGGSTYSPFGVSFLHDYNVGWTNSADTGIGPYLNSDGTSLSVYTNNIKRITVDSNGNIGHGISTSAWGQGKAIDLLGGSLWSTTNGPYLNQNAYFGATSWYYINPGAASQYYQSAGLHVWSVAAYSATAGSLCTFTPVATLSNTGLAVSGVVSANNLLISGVNGATIGFGDVSAAIQVFNGSSASPNHIDFYTSTNKVTTIDSLGNLLIGVSTTSMQDGGKIVLGNNKSISHAGPISYFDTNIYYNGGDRYVSAGYATRQSSINGTITWSTYALGAAGASLGSASTMVLGTSGGVTLTNAEASITLNTTGQNAYSLISGGNGNLTNGFFGIRNNTAGTVPFTIAANSPANSVGITSAGLSVIGAISAIGAAATTTIGITLAGTTTSCNALHIGNTGGNAYFGVEGSTGGNLVTGSSAYDTILSGNGGISISGNNGAGVQARITSTGLAVTGTVYASGDISLGSGAYRWNQSGVRSWSAVAVGGGLSFSSGDSLGTFTFNTAILASSSITASRTAGPGVIANGATTSTSTADFQATRTGATESPGVGLGASLQLTNSTNNTNVLLQQYSNNFQIYNFAGGVWTQRLLLDSAGSLTITGVVTATTGTFGTYATIGNGNYAFHADVTNAAVRSPALNGGVYFQNLDGSTTYGIINGTGLSVNGAITATAGITTTSLTTNGFSSTAGITNTSAANTNSTITLSGSGAYSSIINLNSAGGGAGAINTSTALFVAINGSNITTVTSSGLTVAGALSTTSNITLNNATYFQTKNTGGTTGRLLGINSGNTVYVGDIDSIGNGTVNVVAGGVATIGITASGASVSGTLSATAVVTAPAFQATGYSTGEFGVVTTASTWAHSDGAAIGYGMSTNSGGGLDIMANQGGQAIRFYAGTANNASPPLIASISAGGFSASGNVSATGIVSGASASFTGNVSIGGNISGAGLTINNGGVSGAKLFKFIGAATLYGYSDSGGVGIATSDPYTSGSMYYMQSNTHNWYIGATNAMSLTAGVLSVATTSGLSTNGVSSAATITVTAGESLRLQNDNSYISFFKNDHQTRNGYIQHTGSNLIITSEVAGGVTIANGGTSLTVSSTGVNANSAVAVAGTLSATGQVSLGDQSVGGRFYSDTGAGGRAIIYGLASVTTQVNNAVITQATAAGLTVTGAISGSYIYGTAINIAGHGIGADPYGVASVTCPSDTNNYSYYGLTRSGQIGAGFGITGAANTLGLGANSFAFGSATSESGTGLISGPWIAFNSTSFNTAGAIVGGGNISASGSVSGASASFTGNVFSGGSTEAQIGAILTGYNPVYLYSNASAWGVYSGTGGSAFVYSRSTGLFTFNGASTSSPAGSVTGTALAANVTSSSLTSVGTLLNLTVTNTISGNISGTAAGVNITYGNRSNTNFQLLWGSSTDVYGTDYLTVNASTGTISTSGGYSAVGTINAGINTYAVVLDGSASSGSPGLANPYGRIGFYGQNWFIGGDSRYGLSSNTGFSATGLWVNDKAVITTASIGSQSVSSAIYSSNLSQSGSGSDWNSYFQNTGASQRIWQEQSTGGPTGGWWFAENLRHSNSSGYWGHQNAWGWEGNANELYTRNVSNGIWSDWVRFLNSSNYNSYVPTLTGAGANGTWGINVTGNAGNITTSAVNYGSYGSIGVAGNTNGYAGISFSDYNATLMINSSMWGIYRGNNTWDWRVDSGTLAVGTVPWSHLNGLPGIVYQQDGTRSNADYNGLLSSGFYNGDSGPANAPNQYGQLITCRGSDTGMQIAGGYTSDNLYFRGFYGSGSGFTSWRTVVHSGNISSQAVSTAAKLATSRTINGTSFDGSANITVTAAAGTLTGITLNSTVTASSLTSVGTLTNLSVGGRILVGNGSVSSPSFAFTSDGGQDTGFYWVSDGNIGIAANGTQVGEMSATGALWMSSSVSAPLIYDNGNRVYSASNPQVSIAGNAATATSPAGGGSFITTNNVASYVDTLVYTGTVGTGAQYFLITFGAAGTAHEIVSPDSFTINTALNAYYGSASYVALNVTKSVIVDWGTYTGVSGAILVVNFSTVGPAQPNALNISIYVHNGVAVTSLALVTSTVAAFFNAAAASAGGGGN